MKMVTLKKLKNGMEFTDKKIIFISHSPSKNTKTLSDIVFNTVNSNDLNINIELFSPLEISSESIKKSDGVIIGTTENFGYMAGATKDFFDRCYNELLDNTQGLPVFYYIRAGLDGEGTVRAIDKILLGLKWRQVLKPIVLKGNWNNNFKDKIAEASLNFAIGIQEGIY
jgi:NAD(P)H-dependent FMN reductase